MLCLLGWVFVSWVTLGCNGSEICMISWGFPVPCLSYFSYTPVLMWPGWFSVLFWFCLFLNASCYVIWGPVSLLFFIVLCYCCSWTSNHFFSLESVWVASLLRFFLGSSLLGLVSISFWLIFLVRNCSCLSFPSCSFRHVLLLGLCTFVLSCFCLRSS
jgi:hypothetical protein